MIFNTHFSLSIFEQTKAVRTGIATFMATLLQGRNKGGWGPV